MPSKNMAERKLIAKKFRWLNNNEISIINNEGIEKILDVSKGLIPIN